MENKETILPQDIYAEHLTFINGVYFTRREVEVMACLLSARRTSKIASFLSISPKTVVNHIRNIMLKVECNSREDIIDFLERSYKTPLLRKHYSNLLIYAAFEKNLKEISRLKREETPAYKIVYWTEQEPQKQLIFHLETHLKCAGLTASIEAQKKYRSFSDFFTKPPKDEYVICILPKVEMETFPLERLLKKTEDSELSQKQKFNHVLFVLPERENHEKIIEEFNNVNFVDLAGQNYYFSFFEILKKLLSHIDIEKISIGFREQYEQAHGSSELRFSPREAEEKDTKQEKIVFSAIRKSPLPYGKWLILFLLVIGVLGTGYLFISRIKTGKLEDIYIEGQARQEELPILSDLNLPSETTLLHRPEVIIQIDDKFKNQKGIQTIALVGIGGAGKTTLARQYAWSQKLPIIWEINAETREALKRSFEALAYALSKTEGEKRTLKELQDIKNPEEREDKIILFVRERLKLHSNWLLIYDNIENIPDIQKYFPTNPETWGQGRIILTTRNNNIKNNSYVNNIIQIEDLNFDQKLTLFTKIMLSDATLPLDSLPKEETLRFLNEIPSFPLDVSSAAYYIKATNTTYDKYLENLRTAEYHLSTLQEKILKEAGSYTSTRYKIITTSLKNIVDVHPDFQELLLMISLLDSQNLPRELLDQCKSNIIVDNFIYHIKKYSLVNKKQLESFLNPTLSIHRSTQNIMLSYLTDVLNLEKDKKHFRHISKILKSNLALSIDKEDFSKLKILTPHSEAFLKRSNLITPTEGQYITGELGGAYFYLGYEIKSQHLIEKFLSSDNKDILEVARALTYLGAIIKENKIRDAKTLLEEALFIYKKHPSKNYLGIARTLTYLGGTYEVLEDYEKAKHLLQEAVGIFQEHLYPNHVGCARAYSYLGIVHRKMGHYEEAKALFQKSLSIYERQSKHVGITNVLIHLGNTYIDLGAFKEAVLVGERNLAICKEKFSEHDTSRAHVTWFLGSAYIKLGEYEKARQFLEESRLIYERNFPEKNRNKSEALATLGKAYMYLGNYQESKKLLEESYLIYSAYLPKNHSKIINNVIDLAKVYGKLGQPSQAKALFQENINAYQKHFEKISSQVNLMQAGQTAWCLGVAYKVLNNLEEAIRFFAKAQLIYERHYGKEHIETARILQQLCQVYLLTGKLNLAEQNLRKALNIFKNNNHPESYDVLEDLSKLYLKKSQEVKDKGDLAQSQTFNNQAVNYLKQALEVVKVNFPKNSPHLTRIQSKIKAILYSS